MKKIAPGYYEAKFQDAMIEIKRSGVFWTWNIFWTEETNNIVLENKKEHHDYTGTAQTKHLAHEMATDKYCEVTMGSDWNKRMEELWASL
jgi:hypothetical protein